MARTVAWPAAPPVTTTAYAGIVTRIVAFAVDAAVIVAVALAGTVGIGLVLSVLLPGPLSADPLSVLLTTGGWVVIFGAYLVGFWTLAGQTLGMRLMGIAVCTPDGGRVAPGRGLVRFGGLFLALLPLGLGFALIAVDDHRRGLQDRLAGTVVVRCADR